MKIIKLLFVLSIAVLAIEVASGSSSPAGSTEISKEIPIAIHYPGGKDSLLADIHKELIYPPMAKRNRIQGTALVHVHLEEDGSLTGIKCIKNLGANTGQEAVRIVKTLKFNAPGYRAMYTIPVSFKL